MFSIYGETGRIYTGPMEDLWQVEAVRRVARVRSVAGRTAVVAHAPVAAHPAAGHLAPGVRDALSAYAHSAPAAARHVLARVRDVMSARAFTLTADRDVLSAWRLLGEQGVGQAPVLNADDVLVGMLTRADLLQVDHLPSPDSSALVWRAWLMQPVSSVMWTPVPAVLADTDLRRVARVLIDTHLPGLPVVDEDGRVSGFISRTDILRAVVHDPPLDLWS